MASTSPIFLETFLECVFRRGQFQKLEKMPPRKFRRFTQSKSEAQQALKFDVIGRDKFKSPVIG